MGSTDVLGTALESIFDSKNTGGFVNPGLDSKILTMNPVTQRVNRLNFHIAKNHLAIWDNGVKFAESIKTADDSKYYIVFRYRIQQWEKYVAKHPVLRDMSQVPIKSKPVTFFVGVRSFGKNPDMIFLDDNLSTPLISVFTDESHETEIDLSSDAIRVAFADNIRSLCNKVANKNDLFNYLHKHYHVSDGLAFSTHWSHLNFLNGRLTDEPTLRIFSQSKFAPIEVSEFDKMKLEYGA